MTTHLRMLLQRQQAALETAEASQNDLRAQLEEVKAGQVQPDRQVPEMRQSQAQLGTHPAQRPARPQIELYRANFLRMLDCAMNFDALESLVIGDRSVARLWEAWRNHASCSVSGEWRVGMQTPALTQDQIQMFVADVHRLKPHEMTLQHRSRLTGRFETMLTDTLNVQASIGVNCFNTPTHTVWQNLTRGTGQGKGLLIRRDGTVCVANAATGVTTPVSASQPSLPHSLFIRTDLWEPESFCAIEAMLATEERKLIVLHDRTASVPWSAWLQKPANRGHACVFAACDRIKMRAYMDTRRGNERWYWYKGVWEMWCIRTDGKGMGTDVHPENVTHATQGIFGRMKKWDVKSFWTPLHDAPLPPNFQQDTEGETEKPAKEEGGGGDPDMTHTSTEGQTGERSESQRASSLRTEDRAWRQVQQFWEEWDREAEIRTTLCAQRQIDWKVVEASLRRSNCMLATSPDARLRRIARLAKLPAHSALDTDICDPRPMEPICRSTGGQGGSQATEQ